MTALHASPYGSRQDEVAEEAASLTERLAGWKQDHPGVSMDSLVLLDDEDANLLQWSRSAAVVVVERPRRHWWNSWTHSVVGEVEADALPADGCPVRLPARDGHFPSADLTISLGHSDEGRRSVAGAD